MTNKALEKKEQPVKMGIAHGDSLIGINRRQLNEDNTTALGQNPRGTFKIEANKDIVPDYREDMCPATLDILSKTVYIGVTITKTKMQIRLTQ